MLIGPAHTHRYRRFADTLTSAHARLAEKRGWLVLRFSGLSPPILCQLAWRTVPPPIRPTPAPPGPSESNRGEEGDKNVPPPGAPCFLRSGQNPAVLH